MPFQYKINVSTNVNLIYWCNINVTRPQCVNLDNLIHDKLPYENFVPEMGIQGMIR